MNFLTQNSRPRHRTTRGKTAVRFDSGPTFVTEMHPRAVQATQTKFKPISSLCRDRRVSEKNLRTQEAPKMRVSEFDDNEFKSTLDKIQQRGATFLKFSVQSSEKKGKSKKIFGDFFNLKGSDMRGTMTIGELWTNKQRTSYLKENKIHMSKLKMMEKISKIRMDFNHVQARKTIKNYSKQFSYPSGDQPHYNATKSAPSYRIKDFECNLEQLRRQLLQLNSKNDDNPMKDMMKTLENQSESLNKIQTHYYSKMMQIL